MASKPSFGKFMDDMDRWGLPEQGRRTMYRHFIVRHLNYGVDDIPEYLDRDPVLKELWESKDWKAEHYCPVKW